MYFGGDKTGAFDAQLSALKGMLEAGELKPHVSKIFPFENIADAHLQIESGRTVGKIVVTL